MKGKGRKQKFFLSTNMYVLLTYTLHNFGEVRKKKKRRVED
jgi:hypothetical protein